MYTTSHALLRVCEPRRDIHGHLHMEEMLGCVWGCDSDKLWLGWLLQGVGAGGLRDLGIARFDTAEMGQTGYEPGRGCTNYSSVCVRPLLGVSGPCEGRTRLVGGLASQMSREGPRRRKYGRVFVGRFVHLTPWDDYA
jgi:hypothetical protein